MSLQTLGVGGLASLVGVPPTLAMQAWEANKKPKIPDVSSGPSEADKARAEQLAAEARRKNSRRSTLLTGRAPAEPMGQTAGKTLMGE